MSLKSGHRVAIDFGEKRVGIAISDPSGMIASPVGTFDVSEMVAVLREISDTQEISTIYCGLPVHLSGVEGLSAEKARSKALEISGLDIAPVRLVDERLSTKSVSGDKALVEKYGIDALAAVEILKFALDGERLQQRPFGSSLENE